MIAEARVLVTPDTTAFRGLLVAQTTAAAAGVTVPVAITPVVSGGGLGAGLAGLTAANQQLATSATAATGALRLEQLLAAQGAKDLSALANAEVRAAQETLKADDARKKASQSALTYQRRLSGLSSGAASAGLSLVGLRGATLAAAGPFLAGAAGAIALGKAVGLATSFNSEIAVLGATTGATGEQLTQAAAAAREFGRDITLPGVTAGDAAKTITEFSKAGLDLNESIAATRGGLQLAQAAQLSYTDAVTLTANALNAFGLSGNQAVRVADTLANASNLAQGGIEDTALALRQAASAAEIVGVSFEDTTALLTLLAKNGLTGSDAGTALRTSFLRLVNPSKEANAIIKNLGINLRDAAGNVRPQVFAEFAEAQRNLSVSTQQANAAIVFGQDAFRAFGVLSQEGTEGLNEVQAALGETGTAARIAGARMTGLAGAQENLSNQLSTLGETIGQIATPPLTFFVDELARYVSITGSVISESDAVAEAFKRVVDEIPGGKGDSPIEFGFADAFRAGAAGVRDLNPQVKAIFDFIDILKEGEEEATEEIKNGGVALRSALEDSGREAARGAVSFGDRITNAIDDAFGSIRSRAAAAAQSVRTGLIQAVGQGQGQAAGLDEALNQVIAGGGSEQQQIANLQKQAQVQANIIATAGPNAAGVLLEARREAQAKLAQINSQITAIEGSIAADQQRARDEQQRIREQNERAAAAAFLERQADARGRQERLVGISSETDSLRDDIRSRQDLRVLITQQIAALRQSSLDEEAKRSAIRVLVAAKQATSDEINSLVRTQAQQNQEQREAAQEERESAQIALGESILDLTGNKNVLLRALNAAIKDAQKEKAAAKKGSVAFVEAQTEINNLLKRRKDLLEGVDAESGGKSLAEFLTENTSLFGQLASSGGIKGLDPFSGFDFSSSIVAATTKMQQAVKTQQAPVQQQTRLPDAIDRLIAALERNTDSKSGNDVTGGVITNGGMTYANIMGQRGKALGDFWQAKQARQLEEARFDGGSAT